MLDMLTADAAAQHGHESSFPPGHGCFFSQMPLSMLGSVLRTHAAAPAPANSPVEDSEDRTPANGIPDPAEPQNTPMTTGPDAPAPSPTPSRPVSSSSSVDGKPRRKTPRPKTTFNLAHPPTPAARQKLHIRPKVLLQLHHVIPSSRPKPVYEVIPFSLLAPRSTRRLARTFNTKERLCPSDLLIVKAEAYGDKDEDGKTDDERWGTREVVAIICPAKRSDKDPGDKTEILMDDGSHWEVTNLPNGGYEFSYPDDHGLTLTRRWVPKPAHARRVSTMSSSSQALNSPMLGPDDKRFNFSTISANSRRHPVIASLSRTNIDVLESYAMPSATSPPTPSLAQSGFATPIPTPASIPDNFSFMDKAADRIPVQTDNALRRFIVMSGIWVAFSENWSPAYSWTKSHASPSPLSTSTTFRPTPNRTVSMSFIDSPRSASPASTIDENRRSFPKLFRTGTQKLHNSASFTNSVNSPTSSKASPSSSPGLKTRGRRANSTGNAELTTRKGSTRKRFGLALEDQSLPETEEERQSKRSIELLRLKELAQAEAPSPSLPTTPIPVMILEPPSEYRSPSPASPSSPNPGKLKTQSAYNPVTTAGLWDSGVTEGPGLKTRPTSLIVSKEKKEKAKRKQERSKSREKGKDREKESDFRRRSERFKQRIIGIFRKEKA